MKNFNINIYKIICILKKCDIIDMSKKVFIVGEVLFLLFIVICIGLIYIVHKYFGKYEFYFWVLFIQLFLF